MNNVKNNLHKSEFNETMDRLKAKLGIKTDNKIAELLELNPTSYVERKKRNSIPIDKIKILCIKKSINVNEILKGENFTLTDITEKPCTGNSVCQKICEICMELTPEGKEYILKAAKSLSIMLTDFKTSGYKRESRGRAKTKKTA
jgi:hypothetical protein